MLKCLNAYTATSPVAYQGYWWNLNEESRKEWLKAQRKSSERIYVIN